MLPATAEAFQAPFAIQVQVALDGAKGDIGIGGDPAMGEAVTLEPEDLDPALDAGGGAKGDTGRGGDPAMGEAVTLEPEDLDPALDAGVGVMESQVGQGSPLIGREGESAHDVPTQCRPDVAPRQEFMPVNWRLQLVPDQAEPRTQKPGQRR